MNPAALLSGALSLFGKVPWYGWVLTLLLAWGGWNRHQARSVKADFEQAKVSAAAERADSAASAVAETLRVTRGQQEIVNAKNKQLEAERVAAAAAVDVGRQLRLRLAAVQSRSPAGDTRAAGGCEATAATADLRADMQRRLDEAAEGIALYAGRARIAGETCEASYNTLKGTQ